MKGKSTVAEKGLRRDIFFLFKDDNPMDPPPPKKK